MKTLIASALILLAPTIALAQAPAKSESKPAAKTATAKSTPTKASTAKDPKKQAQAKKAAAPKKVIVAKATRPSSRTQLHSAATQVAAGAVAAQMALTPEELSIADRVHVGRIPCELGAYVTIARDEVNIGRFLVEGKGFRYHMTPVATSTGTVRLEDQKGGAVWLQIANKSMLMNQHLGQRLADECMSPDQTLVAAAIKKNPPVSVLEPLPANK